MSIIIKTASSLSKIFPNGKKIIAEKSNTMFKNERFNFEIAIINDDNSFISGTLKIKSEISKFCNIRKVEFVAGGRTVRKPVDDYVLGKEYELFPELLTPIADNAINLAPNLTSSFFVTIEGAPVGKYKLEILLLKDNNVITSCFYDIQIYDVQIPKNDFSYTNWVHYDCLSEYYNCEVFDDKFYAILKSFLKNAFSHGMNCLYTPLFTPPLDTDIGGERKTVQLIKVKKEGNTYSFDFSGLDKFIDVAYEIGFRKFELSHLFSQWGAECCPKIMAEENGNLKQIFGWSVKSTSNEYLEFLDGFLIKLNNYILENKKIEKCFYHISDEPTDECIERYEVLSKFTHQRLTNAISIDALSHYNFYAKKLVDIPVVATSDITPFLGKDIWAYYCCGQTNNYLSNRFFDFPSERNRVIGAQLFQNNIKGFLQWGYNFYNSCLSKGAINPFLITDANGVYQSGDAFVVYPGKDAPLDSIRHEVFYDALQDYYALTFLQHLTSREYVTNLLIDKGYKQDFNNYPHSASSLINLRKTVNNLIVKYSNKK